MLHNIGRAALLSPVTETVLRRAMDRVDEMSFIGIVERFADTWELLQWTFSPMFFPLATSATFFPLVNYNYDAQRAADAGPTPAQKQWIASVNTFDQRLYEHALERFERSLKHARRTEQSSEYSEH